MTPGVSPPAVAKPWIPSLPVLVEEELKVCFTRRQILALGAMVSTIRWQREQLLAVRAAVEALLAKRGLPADSVRDVRIPEGPPDLETLREFGHVIAHLGGAEK